MASEIERKFIVKKIPQKYLDQTPIYSERYFIYFDNSVELRIQQKDNLFELERKVNGGLLTRETINLLITKNEFNELKQIAKSTLARNSYIIDNNANFSIKEYLGDQKGLIRAEFEFNNGIDAINFVPPIWVGREITNTPLARDSRLTKLTKDAFDDLLREYLSE